MNSFKDKINLDGFSIENIDLSEINKLTDWLPKNGIIDLNIAEQGLVMTLHGQDLCQELIIKIEKWISIKEGQKNKAWTKAALDKANVAGHKTAKNREWFAQADDDFIALCNEVAVAKAAKKWLENKCSIFSGWHYAMKSYLKRDYTLERLGNFQVASFSSEEKEERDEPNWTDE